MEEEQEFLWDEKYTEEVNNNFVDLLAGKIHSKEYQWYTKDKLKELIRETQREALGIK